MSMRVWRILITAGLVAAAPLSPVRASDCDDCGDGGCHAGTVADEFVADRAGLIREWIVRLPFDSTRGQLRHVAIGDGIVVATSRDGHVHAIASSRRAPPAAATPAGDQPRKAPGGPRDDAAAVPAAAPAPPPPAPGSVLWSISAGGPGSTVLPAGIGGDTVTVGGDMGIIAIDAARGGIRWREDVGMPTAAAVPIGDSVYVPVNGGRLRRMLTNPLRSGTTAAAAPAAAKAGADAGADADRRQRRGRRGAADPAGGRLAKDTQLPDSVMLGGGLERPVQPFIDGLIWTTTAGRLVALERGMNDWVRHEFDLLSKVVDAPLIRGRSIFVATVASDLARVDLPASGPPGLRTGWHTVLDRVPDAGPFLGGNTIVVSLGDDGLAAFAADTGRPQWRSSVAGTVIAVGGDRVWLIDRVGRLSGIDMATGERRERFCLGCLTVPIVNTVSDRLFLASNDGLLVCLAPKRSVPDAFPKPTPVKKQTPRAGREPAAEEPEPRAEQPPVDPDAPAADDDR